MKYETPQKALENASFTKEADYIIASWDNRKGELFSLFDEHEKSILKDGLPVVGYRPQLHDKMIRLPFFHLGSNVFVIHKEKLYVPIRAKNKDLYPGFADISVSEHVKVGEDYLGAAIRGCEEELGVTAKKEELKELFKIKIIDGGNREFAQYYILKNSVNITLSDESSKGFWVPIKGFFEALAKKGVDFREDHLPALKKFLDN